jgi:hypothetical protein
MFLAGYCLAPAGQQETASWEGTLRDSAGHGVAGAIVGLENAQERRTATTDADGSFRFSDLPAGGYSVSVRRAEQFATARSKIELHAGVSLEKALQLTAADELELTAAPEMSKRPQPAASVCPVRVSPGCRSTSATSANCCYSLPARRPTRMAPLILPSNSRSTASVARRQFSPWTELIRRIPNWEVRHSPI